jgi:hypothetical protein
LKSRQRAGSLGPPTSPIAGSRTLEGNLAALPAAMLSLQRGLLPLLAGLIGKPTLLRRFLAELHSSDIGGPDLILRTLDNYLAAEQRLGRVRSAAGPHLVGILLFAITQLHALATRSRNPRHDLSGTPSGKGDAMTRIQRNGVRAENSVLSLPGSGRAVLFHAREYQIAR